MICVRIHSNRAAALAVMTAAPLLQASALGLPRPDPVAALRSTAASLLSQFARLDPEWGELNRLKRDDVDLPLAGAPDALRDIELRPNVRGPGDRMRNRATR